MKYQPVLLFRDVTVVVARIHKYGACQNPEFLNVKEGGMHTYHYALKVKSMSRIGTSYMYVSLWILCSVELLIHVGTFIVWYVSV